ncbi:MAG: MFS transporter [Coriobacteriia bacterium]
MARSDTPRDVIRTYMATYGLFTLATSLIWAVNTLFLLDAGLDIFTVMVVNSAFTIGQLVFEIPTGVVADTIGRKASFLLGIASLAVATLLYVMAAELELGIPMFIGASLLLGFGFTCQTGALEAWVVDALAFTGYTGALDGVFARGQIVFGIATLLGTVGGGLLGQADLALPYYVRSAVLGAAFVLVVFTMKDLGFESRPLHVRRLGQETRSILTAGTRYGWRNPVVRPMMFAALVQGAFFIFGFYSWQRYFLDLLARELVWVNGVVTAAFAGAGILGNLLVGRASDGGQRAVTVLVATSLAQPVLVVAIGLVGMVVPESSYGLGPFLLVAGMYVVFGLLDGIQLPVRQAYLNRHIPSAQRATVLSLDAFFSEGGASAGQLGFGWISRAVSIPVAWVISGVMLLVAAPLYRAAGARDVSVERERASE